MNLERKQHNHPRWNQQANLVSAVPPIGSSQVWSGLSEQEQQMVTATVVKMCQTLAHLPAKPTESATYEHIC